MPTLPSRWRAAWSTAPSVLSLVCRDRAQAIPSHEPAPALTDDDTALSLVCDANGALVAVVRDDLGLLTGRNAATTLVDLVSPAFRSRAAEFLEVLCSRRGAFDWELGIAGSEVTLHFAGFAEHGRLRIVGSGTRAGLVRLNDELKQVDNEPELPPPAVKGLFAQTASAAAGDAALYEDLSRMNNELATLQREAVRSNFEHKRDQDALRKLNAELQARVEASAAELAQARHEADRASQSKAAFLVAMSDELRAPARDMIATLDALHRTLLEAPQVEMVASIRNHALSLVAIIEHIDDVSTIDAGGPGAEAAPMRGRGEA